VIEVEGNENKGKEVLVKSLVVLLTLFSGLTVWAQSTNAVATNSTPAQPSQSLQTQTTGRMQPAISFGQLKPNEMMSGKVLCSGIVVEAVKTRKPLQLISPLAPPEYGTPEDNLVRGPINSRIRGLKIFAIRF